MAQGLSVFERHRLEQHVRNHPVTDYAGRNVFGALNAFYNEHDGECFPSLPTLAAKAGFGLKPTRQGIAQLEAIGVLKVDRANGKVPRYRFVLPPELEKRPPAHPRPSSGDRPLMRRTPAQKTRPPLPKPAATHAPRAPEPEGINNPSISAAPTPPDVNVDAVLRRCDPLEVHRAIQRAGMSPQTWGSSTFRLQVAQAARLKYLRVPEGERSRLTGCV